MIFNPRKAALYQLAIEHGLQNPEEICSYLPLGSSVPKARLERWLRQLFQPPKKFSTQHRYVNRFKLGADPEFVFVANKDGNGREIGPVRIDAGGIGLAQGPAFGADNNGRLAEIRPHPSRSAVEVVASILCTLRWMAICYPQVMQFQWLSGAFLMDDGIGGHVHFGRKRPTRKEEVAALDAVEEALLSIGVFPRAQVIRRRQGDARRQIYGALGDFRLQQHGYEYRTFPSWLDSPELAFITLVVSKLAVHMPTLYRVKSTDHPRMEQARLRNFLAYFKGVDDDARLALAMLERGWPAQRQGSFAVRWGIKDEAMDVVKRERPVIIPPSIKPDAASVQEIFDYLHAGKPLQFRVPEITWSPTAPLKDYVMVLPNTHTIQAKGLGEMVWDLCYHKNMPVSISSGSRGMRVALVVARNLAERFPTDWQAKYGETIHVSDEVRGIVTASEWREGPRARLLKRILLSGMFPLWRVQDCKPDSYKVWSEQAKNTSASRKLAGSVIFESQSHKVGPLAMED